MRVVGAQLAQRTSQVDHVVPVRTTGSGATIDLPGHYPEGGRAEKRRILRRCNVNHAIRRLCIELDTHAEAFVAILLAVVQVFEYVRFDEEGAANAGVSG